jgi:eukaryotic-like serine/threonine-protein kinase
LQHAHEQGLIHRDIKPGNLLIGRYRPDNSMQAPTMCGPAWERFCRWGQVKLLDMGLVLLQDQEASNGPQGPITQQGFALGTVDYMAPEQVVNPHLVDIRADLYSLGCTFYEMLTGHVPFPKGSPVQKLLAHRTEEPVPVQQERPEVPEEVAVIVHTLLSKQPTRRYQTPGEAAEAMAEVLIRMSATDVDLDWKPPLNRKGTAPAAPAENESPAAEEEDAGEAGGSNLLYLAIAAAVFVISFLILFRVL